MRLRPVQFWAGAKIIAKSNLRLVPPDSELRTVTLRRRSNRNMGRDREHLTELEVDRLKKAARGNRHGQRDATMILIGFRHGLRVSELCDLQWSSIAFETGTMHAPLLAMAGERRTDGYGERKAHRPILATAQSVRPRAMPLAPGRFKNVWGRRGRLRPGERQPRSGRLHLECHAAVVVCGFKSAGRGFSYLTPCLCGPWCFTTEARSFWMPSTRRRMTYKMEAFLVAALACGVVVLGWATVLFL